MLGHLLERKYSIWIYSITISISFIQEAIPLVNSAQMFLFITIVSRTLQEAHSRPCEKSKIKVFPKIASKRFCTNTPLPAAFAAENWN